MAERGDVERLVVGTAGIGLPYGLPPPGEDRPRLVPRAEAVALVREALDAGIGAFDTAPAYGEAESRLGEALGPRGRVWTKIGAPPAGVDVCDHVDRSLAASCRSLGRRRLDLVQWHNWTRALADEGGWRGCWRALGDDPRVAALGASTYGVDDAIAAVESGWFSVVQIEWNLLNQRVLAAVSAPAAARGVAIAVRSVFLQGVLTEKGLALPPSLAALAGPLASVRALAGEWGMAVPALALRAALDEPAVAWALVGLDGRSQLADAVAAARLAPLGAARRARLAALDLGGAPITDPRTWKAA